MGNRFKVGDLEVLAVSDGQAAVPGTFYFRGTTDEQWEKHKRWLNHAGQVEFPFSCFLIDSGGQKVLIDTGLGPASMSGFTGGALLDELAAGGVRPEDVDVVFLTHLHIDHCGNVAHDDGEAMKAVFPNATYRWTADENEWWQEPDPRAATAGPGPRPSSTPRTRSTPLLPARRSGSRRGRTTGGTRPTSSCSP